LFQNYSGDLAAHSRIEKYISSEEMMRKESLHYSSIPCESLENDRFDEKAYRVASTGAVVNLNSSIPLIQLYCARLPADGLVHLSLPLFHIHFSPSNEPSFIPFIIHLIWFFKLSGILNHIRGGTNKKEYCIFLRVVL
jgi:hypothetical protein